MIISFVLLKYITDDTKCLSQMYYVGMHSEYLLTDKSFWICNCVFDIAFMMIILLPIAKLTL